MEWERLGEFDDLGHSAMAQEEMEDEDFQRCYVRRSSLLQLESVSTTPISSISNKDTNNDEKVEVSTTKCYLNKPSSNERCEDILCDKEFVFLKHVFSKHRIGLLSMEGSVLQWFPFLVDFSKVIEWKNLPPSMYSSYFGMHFLTCVGIDHCSKSLYWWSYFVDGDIHDVGNFRLTLVIQNPKSGASLSWSGPIHYLYSTPDEVFKSGLCLELPRDSFKLFMEYNQKKGCTEWIFRTSVVPVASIPRYIDSVKECRTIETELIKEDADVERNVLVPLIKCEPNTTLGIGMEEPFTRTHPRPTHDSVLGRRADLDWYSDRCGKSRRTPSPFSTSSSVSASSRSSRNSYRRRSKERQTKLQIHMNHKLKPRPDRKRDFDFVRDVARMKSMKMSVMSARVNLDGLSKSLGLGPDSKLSKLRKARDYSAPQRRRSRSKSPGREGRFLHSNVIQIAAESSNSSGAGICIVRQCGKPHCFYTYGPMDNTIPRSLNSVEWQFRNVKNVLQAFEKHFDREAKISLSCSTDLSVEGAHSAEAELLENHLNEIRKRKSVCISIIDDGLTTRLEKVAAFHLLSNEYYKAKYLLASSGLKNGNTIV